MINSNTQYILENSSVIKYGLPIALLMLFTLGIIYLLIKIYNQHNQLKKDVAGVKGNDK
jgi:hypothetical protein